MKRPGLLRRQKWLQVESLEPRYLLSGDGIVPVGQQPDGGLAGKVVYIHAGHGWTANNQGSGAWSTQRPETFEMVEDLGNQDQMTFLADYLYRAGATVVPIRPIGHQRQEVILDNANPNVTFFGNWSDSSATIYFGNIGDVPYRFTTTSVDETAYARYRPQIVASGFYPVYTWVTAGGNRASDQLYRVTHSGGTTEVTVNHQMVGSGLVYLGTYYFEQGNTGYVDVSNRSNDPGKAVIADMIRFGNGIGDIDRGGGVSGQDRVDEAGLYWVKWHVDRSRGIPESSYRTSSDDGNATVSASPRYSTYMNNASVGTLADRVFVSYHSNASTGTARGVLGLYNGNNDPTTATPNQLLLAQTLASEINSDLVAQNGLFEHDWQYRSTVTLDRSDIEFGEINNHYIANEFDATIMETGFHDNQLDAEMLRDPRVRDALARSTYQGLVRYFRAVDGNSTPLTMLPGPVTNVRAESMADGEVRLSWTPPIANSYQGDAPTGYRIYTSLNGYGFDGGTYVPGGGTSTHTISGLDSGLGVHYFQIVAENGGGQSKPSEVLAASPTGGSTRILIVNGFDRFDRTLNPRQPYLSGAIDRVRPRQSNAFDYAVQFGEAVEAYSTQIAIDTAANELVANGTISLSDYRAVFWILGEESSVHRTFDPQEQQAVAAYLAAGGKLFASGAEIGWDLDFLNNGRSFYQDTLHARYVMDDANTYQVAGTIGSIFSGLAFGFDNGTQFYDVNFPDVIATSQGSVSALSYVGGTSGTAAVVYSAGAGQSQVVTFGFPFESILTVASREQVMARILDYFQILQGLPGDFDGDGELNCSDVGALTRQIAAGTNNPVYDLNQDGLVNLQDLVIWVVQIRQTLFADANLDGAVDGTDFGIWNAHKFQADTDWCSGDFNADGLTDGSDFNFWNSNKFQSTMRLEPWGRGGSNVREGADRRIRGQWSQQEGTLAHRVDGKTLAFKPAGTAESLGAQSHSRRQPTLYSVRQPGPGKERGITEMFFDAEQLIVLRDSIGP